MTSDLSPQENPHIPARSGLHAGRDRAWLEIDPGAIRHNLQQVRSAVGPEVGLIGVVKGDAYGHGAVRIATTLAQEGVDFFAVATVDEGLELREGGIGGSMLILGAVSPQRVEGVVEASLTPIIVSVAHAEALSRALGDRELSVHLKIDSGMCRMGVRWDEIEAACHKLRALRNLEYEGVLSHFAAAGDDDSFSHSQLSAFEDAIACAENILGPFDIIHMGASQALLSCPRGHFDMVRPGNILYGSVADIDAGLMPDLRPAMALKARLALVKQIQAGDAVGYGCTYHARAAEYIGVVPVGYADGYFRSLSNCADVLIGGRRCPVIGRVSMDSTIVRLGPQAFAAAGDEVVLLGSQGDETISAEELARRAGTITQEIFSAMSRRLPRIYRDE
ncbi:MAG: alanine racemase [Armatimonadota bacterium]